MDARIEAALLRLAARWTAEAQALDLAADRAGREVAAKHRALGGAAAYMDATVAVWDLVGLEDPKPDPVPDPRRCPSCGGDGRKPDPTIMDVWHACPLCEGTGSPDIPPPSRSS